MNGARAAQPFRWKNGAALLALGWLAIAPAAAKSPTQEEADAAFRLFLNVKEELVQRCIYRPSEVKVLADALHGLERELDPDYAPYFPASLAATFPEAWEQYQAAIKKLAAARGLEARTVKDLVEQSLRACAHQLDRYSDYDDLSSWQRETALKKPEYVGVGMTLERTPEGFDCYPFPAGPADFAGCISGDRLLEVDSKLVRGHSAVDVASLFPGPEHSVLRIKVRHISDGKEEVLEIKREQISASFIAVEHGAGGVAVRLRRLNDATVKELRAFLRTAKAGQPLTLDLRGCHGGELSAAVAIAELFLPKGAVICKVETRGGQEAFRSADATPFRAKPLIILQDKGTMSGAELITAALVTSPEVRAESHGDRSYGKGVTLSEVEVVGGGRLRFADGRIYGPHGEFWDGEGLTPTSEVTLRPQ